MSTLLLNCLAIVGLIVLSAFFSGSEIAFSSASRLRLKSTAEDGTAIDRLVYAIYEAFDRMLITVLIGNNLVNIAASSVATVIALELIGDKGAVVATFVMTVLILIFGEIIPKIVCRETCYRAVKLFALPLKGISMVAYPVVWCVERLFSVVDRFLAKRLTEGPSVTEDDLDSVLDTVEDEGVIDEDRCELLQSAMDFDEVLAYEIITPRVDMLAVDIEDTPEEILETVMDAPFSRIPVYRDTVDHIVGILHLNRLFRRIADGDGTIDHETIHDCLLPANFVYKTMPLPDVLKHMKKRKCHMVIVTDEYGGTMGILTMEDVLEQLVGDIWDEMDEIVPEFVELGDDNYEADGDMRTEDLFEELDIPYDDFEDDNATLGGWAIEMLGGYPRVGDSFTYQNLTVTIQELQNLRVMRVRVHCEPLPEEDD